MTSRIYKLWSRVLTWFGDLYWATKPPKVRAANIRDLLAVVQPGDVLCRFYDRYIDGYFIPGKYTHSGIVVDQANVIHAVAEGVCRVDLMDFVMDTNGFIVLRPDINVDRAVEFAAMQVGKPYDFAFSMRTPDAWYCHEVTHAALAAGGLKVPVAHPDIVLADDLIAACRCVYEVPQ